MSIFFYSKWLALPINTRHRIAQQFNIPKTSPTHVVDNQIQNDGYKIQDIESGLNEVALMEFLETDVEDHATLWDMLILKIDPSTPKPMVDTEDEQPISNTSYNTRPRTVRKASDKPNDKKDKKNK